MTVEEASAPPVEFFADTKLPLDVFLALDTQWRFAATTPMGLDYGALPAVFQMLAVPRRAWPDLFADLRVMEEHGLKTMHAVLAALRDKKGP